MPLYVLSATPEEPLRRIVERRGWTGYFQDVLGRPGSKAEHLRAVLTREGIAGGDLLMVGDGKRDVDAARHVGTRFIGVRSAFNDFDRMPLVLLDDLTALPDLIESSAAPAPLLPGD
jgi:phosphoglycolate phosphatase-like HAD superfamily hydrolase